MGEQATLFALSAEPEVEPVSLVPESSVRRVSEAPKSRRRLRVVPIQVGLMGVDELAEATRKLAEWGVPRNKCPWLAGIEDCQCWWLSCPNHGRNELGNEAAQVSDDEITEEVTAAKWTCDRHFVKDHPDGATLDEIAEFFGISRQSLQDRMEEAIERLVDAVLWYAEELGRDDVDDTEEFREKARRRILAVMGGKPALACDPKKPAGETMDDAEWFHRVEERNEELDDEV